MKNNQRYSKRKNSTNIHATLNDAGGARRGAPSEGLSGADGAAARQAPLKKLTTIFSVLFLFLLPTQLGKHFFLPFSYISGIRIDYLAPTLYLTDITAVLLIALNIKTVVNFFRNRTSLIFCVLLLINLAFSLVKPIALYQSLKIVEVLSMFAVFSKIMISNRAILITLILGACAELALTITQFINQHSVQGIAYFFGERYFSLSQSDIAKASLSGIEFLRPYGTFSHPNSMAGFYLLVYIFTLTFPFFNRHRILKYILLLISSALVLISFSKIVVLTYVLLTIFYLITTKKWLRCKFCFFARMIILTILAFIFFIPKGDALTIEKRVTLAGNALEIFKNHILTGVGIGNYLIAQSVFPIKYSYFFLQPVHNIFMLFLTESGIVLTGFVVYILCIFFKKQWNNRTIEPLLYCTTAILLTGMFDHYWLTLQQNFLLAAVVFGLLQRQIPPLGWNRA